MIIKLQQRLLSCQCTSHLIYCERFVLFFQCSKKLILQTEFSLLFSLTIFHQSSSMISSKIDSFSLRFLIFLSQLSIRVSRYKDANHDQFFMKSLGLLSLDSFYLHQDFFFFHFLTTFKMSENGLVIKFSCNLSKLSFNKSLLKVEKTIPRKNWLHNKISAWDKASSIRKKGFFVIIFINSLFSY